MVDELSPEQAETLALAFAGKSELVPEGHPENNFFGYGALPNAASLLRFLLHRIDDSTTREKIALSVAENITSLPLAFEYRQRVRKLRKDRGSDEFVAVVSDECEQKISRIIAGKFAKSSEVAPLEDSHPLYKRGFYIEWRFGDLDSLRSYARQQLERHPAHIGRFLAALLGIGETADSGQISYPDEDYQFITTILEPNAIREYIRQAFPNSLDTAPFSVRWFVGMYEQMAGIEETNQDSDLPL